MARIPVALGVYEVSVSPEGAAPVSLGAVEVGRGERAFRACRVLGGPHPVGCGPPERRRTRRQ